MLCLRIADVPDLLNFYNWLHAVISRHTISGVEYFWDLMFELQGRLLEWPVFQLLQALRQMMKGTKTPARPQEGALEVTREQAEQVRKLREVYLYRKRAKAVVERAEERLKQAEGSEVVDGKRVQEAKDDVFFARKLLQGDGLGLQLAKGEEQGDNLHDTIDNGVPTCFLCFLYWLVSTSLPRKLSLKTRPAGSSISMSSNQIQTHTATTGTLDQTYRKSLNIGSCQQLVRSTAKPSNSSAWSAGRIKASVSFRWSRRDHWDCSVAWRCFTLWVR